MAQKYKRNPKPKQDEESASLEEAGSIPSEVLNQMGEV